MKTSAKVAAPVRSARAEDAGSLQIASGEDGARGEVVRRLLIDGPSTAAHLAAALGVSGTAVRRQLDALHAEGSVTCRDAAVAGRRGRGRPAQVYLLTDLGRRRLPHAYDELAEEALGYLAEHVGPEAVTQFARQRAERIVDTVRGELDAASTVAERARILAKALSRSGYVASVDEVGIGEQLSQHHCPVAHVAGKYPALCEQELAVFTETLGTYAQRLATIARGDSFCTTFIPDPVIPNAPSTNPQTTPLNSVARGVRIASGGRAAATR